MKDKNDILNNPQLFRQRELARQDEERERTRPVITKHFEALCEIAEVFAASGDTCMIKTPYGMFVFHKA
jgi:hypothetical protein